MLEWNDRSLVDALADRDVAIGRDFVCAVSDAVHGAAAHWGDVPYPPDFVSFLAERIPADADLESSTVPVAVRDLYLACAALSGDTEAVRRLRELLRATVARGMLKLQLDMGSIDDIEQLVLEKLLVNQSGAKLSGYRGRGPLRAWLRSFAIRTALKTRRRRAIVPNDTEVLSSVHTETEYMTQHYGDKFRTALSLAFRELSARERNLLRQHYLDALTLAQLGKLYLVNRSTVARWLGAARARLVTRTRRVARQELGVPRREFDSLLRLVWSQLRPNLRELLRTDAKRPPDSPQDVAT